MKKFCFIMVCISLSSCASWKQIGALTVISPRNVDGNTKYIEKARYVDSRKTKELPRAIRKAHDNMSPMEIEIEKMIYSTPGGDFIKNAKIYTKNGEVKIIGDVWGYGGGESSSPIIINQNNGTVKESNESTLKTEKVEDMEVEKKDSQPNIYGMVIGDTVKWKSMGKVFEGVIMSIKGEKAVIKTRKGEFDSFVKMSLSQLTKIEASK